MLKDIPYFIEKHNNRADFLTDNSYLFLYARTSKGVCIIYKTIIFVTTECIKKKSFR